MDRKLVYKTLLEDGMILEKNRIKNFVIASK